MLRDAVIAAVREEVRSVLKGIPTPQSVLEDMGFVLGALPPEEALAFAKVALTPLADFIDSTQPAPEPETEPTGAEGTGD